MECIIIDNKPIAQNSLVENIKQIPYLELNSYCSTVFEGYEAMQSQNIDLIFIDTDMPKVSGIDFIKSLDNKPMFIFTSSNPLLAIEGFNLNALDFLLKPFSFDRLLRSANKAFEFYSFKHKTKQPDRDPDYQGTTANDFVLVKSDYQTIRINLEDILYIEGLKDYIKIYTSKAAKPVITLNSLKRLQKNLPPEKFSRIHKSYIIGMDHINTINKSQVVINDKYIPIGESYKNIFMDKIEDMKI
jgi:DNA-binding LytR/AlgR family response regulator